MQLTIEQAAARLGKSRRQIRYLIKAERLPARKFAGRWVIDSEAGRALPRVPRRSAGSNRGS